MSLRPVFFLAFGLLLLAAACFPTRYFLGDLPPVQLRIGSGGGVTGAFKEYLILRNGQTFLLESGPAGRDTFELEAFAWPERRDLFRQLDELRLIRYDFNFPGDQYFFIRQLDEQIDHKVQWGDPRFEVREEVEAFYADLTGRLEARKVIFSFGKEQEKDKEQEPTYW